MSPCLCEKQTRSNQIQRPCGNQFRAEGAAHDVSSVILLAKVALSQTLASYSWRRFGATTFIGRFLSEVAYWTDFLTAQGEGAEQREDVAQRDVPTVRRAIGPFV